MYDADEFPYPAEIFGRYPLTELIVHPRIQKDFYNNTPNLEAFSIAYENKSSKFALCYNGDIFHPADCEKICLRFPDLSAVMMGRGLLQNQSLAEEIKVRENSGGLNRHQEMAYFARFFDRKSEEDERKRRYEFYRRLPEDYSRVRLLKHYAGNRGFGLDYNQQKEDTMDKIKLFLQKKNIVISAKRYGIDALGAMAQGLFASLLIGTILATLGEQLGIGLLASAGGYAKAATGPAMAVSIGCALECPQLVLFSLAAVGGAANELGGAGGPLAVLIITVFAAEFGKAVSKETKIDILVTPFVTITVGILLADWWAPAVGAAAGAVGDAIMWATELQPFFMGIAVSVIAGIALTLPISSAAICAALGLTGLAGGAALAGCCAQMIGFAVLSFRENGWGGFFAQGIGTSMLQMGNIIKNPLTWIPAIFASAVTGPAATCIFKLQMNGAAVASGMGTCGLVGQIGVYTGWLNDIASGTKGAVTAMDWISLLLVCFVLPGILTWIFGILLRRLGWIKENDLKLDL